MRIKEKKTLNAPVLLALFAVQMLMHMNVDNLLLDDWTFFSVLELGQSIPAWLMERWQTWSSRLLIETVLSLITHSIWAFRILDSAVMVVLAYGLARLANADDRPEMMALSSLLVTAIPFAVLRSTGWMASSLNYYWPLAATAIALIPLADALWGRATAKHTMLAAVLCAVFGANQEQTSAVIMGSYLVLGGYLAIKNRKISALHATIFAIAAAELALHLICPGNAIRAQESMAIVNLRDYMQFSLIDKLSIGLTSTTALLFFTYCPVLLACGVTTASTIAARRRGLLAYALLLPIAEMLLLGWQSHAMETMSGAAGWMQILHYGEFNDYVLQLGPQRMDMLSLIAVARIVIVLGLMALSLYLSLGHRSMALMAVFIYAIGFAARMALAFSPTVVESGERTMLPLYGAMMLCALLCVRDCRQEGARRWPLAAAFAVCVVVAGINVLGSFALAA